MFSVAIKKISLPFSFSKKMAEIVSADTLKIQRAQNSGIIDKIAVEEDARKMKRANLETSLEGF